MAFALMADPTPDDLLDDAATEAAEMQAQDCAFCGKPTPHLALYCGPGCAAAAEAEAADTDDGGEVFACAHCADGDCLVECARCGDDHCPECERDLCLVTEMAEPESVNVADEGDSDATLGLKPGSGSY